MNVPSPFGADEPAFDAYDEFEPSRLPEPGAFLDGHDVLTGRDHVAFHRLTRRLFGARGVIDVTFGYNLARLNLDRRHTDAGYRYARSADDPAVLLAEFTPTTAFCPQSATLARGSFRAWNGLADRHEYDLVRVRVDETHHRSGVVNRELRDHEQRFEETGELPEPGIGVSEGPAGVPDEAGYARDPDASF